MAHRTTNIARGAGAPVTCAETFEVNVQVDSADSNKLKYNADSTAYEVITDVSLQASNHVGSMIVKRVTFTENATSTLHTATIPIPAGATLHDIQVDMGVLWTGGTASLDVGDTADPNGYFVDVDLKATDLLVGEQLRLKGDHVGGTAWGGVNGAYLVAATGRTGPTSSNFGGKYLAGSNIIATVAVGTPATTAGRTYITVVYSLGAVIAPVLT